MGKKHQDGAKTGKPNQPPARHRGPETGSGFTASTGRGKPKGGLLMRILDWTIKPPQPPQQ